MPARPNREDAGSAGREELAARMRRARRAGDGPKNAILDAEVARHRLAPVPPFPVDAIPEPLQSAVVRGAEALGAPPDFVAAGFLASVSTLIGSRAQVELGPTWRESGCLYLAAVGDPSTKKTPALRLGVSPVHRLQEALFADAAARAREAAQREKEGEEDEGRPEAPEARHVAVADITVEALFEILDSNAGGVCAAWDELGGWVKSQNAYRNGFGSDREFWQAAWSGTPYYVDRKSRAENGQRLSYMLHPFVTVVGGIQPDLLTELTTNGRGRPTGRDGMLERLLFAWPETGIRRPGTPVPDDVTEATRALFDRLADMRFVRVDGHFQEVPSARVVGLSDDGAIAWSEVEDGRWGETSDAAVPAWWKGVAGKLHSYHARFALLIAVVRARGLPGAVTAEDIRAAGELVRYFRATARRAWTVLYGDKAIKRHAAILAWARRHGASGLTVRQAVRAEVAGVRTADEAREAFRELAALGLGRFEVVERSGAKPAEVFWPDHGDNGPHAGEPGAQRETASLVEEAAQTPGGRGDPRPGSSGLSGGLSGGCVPSEPNGRKHELGLSGLSGASLRPADADTPPPLTCRACGGVRHWRLRDGGPWVCAMCHTPVAGAEVQWAPPDGRGADRGVV